VGEADCYLVFDVLTGAGPQQLTHAHADRTVAIVSTSEVPTGKMVQSTKVGFPKMPSLLDAIEECTRKNDNVYFDAIELAEALFESHMAANMIVVGAAYQAGLLPISAESIEDAIELNGTAVEMNRQAFRVGRRVVIDPAWAKTVQTKRPGSQEIAPVVTPEAQALIDRVGAPVGSELHRLLTIRVPELIAYHNLKYAEQYVAFVRQVRDAEAGSTNHTALSETVARYLFKLMAFKDEYEVARLSLRPELEKTFTDQFGVDADMQFYLMPPFMKALGLKNKIKFGRWFLNVFRMLYGLRGLRFTALDVFGYDHIRRLERALIVEYRDLIAQAIVALNSGNYDRAVKLAGLPDLIRGYDDVKLANIEAYHREVAALGFGTPTAQIGQPKVAVGAGD
jgi:indolepyruvate ferredoxin oxidoreductase